MVLISVSQLPQLGFISGIMVTWWTLLVSLGLCGWATIDCYFADDGNVLAKVAVIMAFLFDMTVLLIIVTRPWLSDE
jgi:hypothetical protein